MLENLQSQNLYKKIYFENWMKFHLLNESLKSFKNHKTNNDKIKITKLEKEKNKNLIRNKILMKIKRLKIL